MPPSRRRILELGALSMTALGGCSGLGDPPPDGTPTETPDGTETPDPTATPTDEVAPELVCGTGPLPDAGWPLSERSVGRTNYAPDGDGPTEKPSAEWSVTATAPEQGEVRFTRPIVADGRIYVGRNVAVGTSVPKPDKQYLQAYDAATGDRLWEYAIAGTPQSVATTDEAVLVADRSTLHAVESGGESARWTHEPDGGVDDVLPIPDGVLVASTRADSDDTVVALLSDGEVEWDVTVDAWLDSSLGWTDGRAYLATNDAELVAIDTDEGEQLWTRNLHDREDRNPATLLVTPCAVFVAVDEALYAADRDGEVAWSVNKSFRDLATDGEYIYGVDGDGYARSLSIEDGEEDWEEFRGAVNERYTDGFFDGLAIDDETLYAGTLEDGLLAISTDSGDVRWVLERDLDGVSVSVVDDTLYAAWGNRLLAFE